MAKRNGTSRKLTVKLTAAQWNTVFIALSDAAASMRDKDYRSIGRQYDDVNDTIHDQISAAVDAAFKVEYPDEAAKAVA